MVGVGIESNYGCLVIGLIDINSDVFNIVYNGHHIMQHYRNYTQNLASPSRLPLIPTMSSITASK